MSTLFTRRRFIGITAAAAGIATLSLNRTAGTPAAATKHQLPEAVIWRGIALGADAELRLYHPNKQFAHYLIEKSLGEVERLEKIFSLYRNDSQLVMLNKAGHLANPSADMLAILSTSRSLNRLTQGAFDPTIQPLWQFYARHFRLHPNGNSAPDRTLLRQTLAAVGLQHVAFDNHRIFFKRPGMALSFNGIAQGYITDRITNMLRNAGLEQALVDMGEIRGLDAHCRHFWQAGIRNPEKEHAVLTTLPLQNQALATSGGYGTTMDEEGRFTHLFHPQTGKSTPRYRSVSVMADNALTADALSTAFAVSDKQAIQQVVAQNKNLKVWLLPLQGGIEQLG